LLALLSALSSSGARAEDGAAQPSQHKRPRFESEAHAGTLEVRVRRPDGRLVWSLKKDDFVVEEGGVVQPVIMFEPPRAFPVSLAILLDGSATVGEKLFSDNRELVFRLIHLLEPTDDIILGFFDNRQVVFLTDLTSDRKPLVEALWSLSPNGRPGRWSRLGQIAAGGIQLGNDSLTGQAVDQSLLRLKAADHTNKLVLVLSSGFGDIGPGTLDHLDLAGARLFAVVSGKQGFADTINLGGNRKSGLAVVRSTGGLDFACDRVLGQITELRDAIKKYYLLAYATEKASDKELRISVRNHPEYEVSRVPRIASTNTFY